jgi:hypothetical protein
MRWRGFAHLEDRHANQEAGLREEFGAFGQSGPEHLRHWHGKCWFQAKNPQMKIERNRDLQQ